MADEAAEVDVSALYATLDAERRERGLSWRQVAGALSLSPSTFTRMGNGHQPDLKAFVVLARWLGMPTDRFLVHVDDPSSQTRPSLMAELAPLLRGRADMNEEDARHLETVFQQALTTYRAQRPPR